MKSYKDIISAIKTQDDLDKHLEDLLKNKENNSEAFSDPRFKELSEARNKFRTTYKNIRKHEGTTEDDITKDLKETEEEEEKVESEREGNTDSDTSDTYMEKIIQKLPDVLMTDEQKKQRKREKAKLKKLESQYLARKEQMEMALKRLAEDERIDLNNLKKEMAQEVSEGVDKYDFAADHEELSRMIEELKEMAKDFEEPSEGGVRIEEIKD